MSFASGSRCCRCVASYSVILLLILSNQSNAAQWQIEPKILIAENYTDNVNFLPEGQEITDFVTQLNPGVKVVGRGARMTFDFDYTMQNLFYKNQDVPDSDFHQLDFTTNSEVLREQFFVETAVRRSQFSTDPNQITQLDELIGIRKNLTTFRISPYYQREFNGNLEVKLKYAYDDFNADGEVDDTVTKTITVALSNVANAKRFKWNVNYSDALIRSEGDNRISITSLRGEASLNVFRHLNFQAEWGYFENEVYQAFADTNGKYGAIGLGWYPNVNLHIAAVYGNAYKSADFLLRPSAHAEFIARLVSSDVGLNNGRTATGQFNLTLRKTTLGINFLEEVTTVQQLLSNADSRNTVVLGIGPVDGLFKRQRRELAIKKGTIKTNTTLALYKESRDFLSSLDVDAEDRTVSGGNVSFDWRMTSRTNITAKFGSESSTIKEDIDDARLHFYSLEVVRRTIARYSLTLKYLHSKRIDPTTVDLGGGVTAITDENTIESRIQASFVYTF